MRKLLLFVLLLPFAASAQTEYQDFKIIDNNLVFQKIYTTELKVDDLNKSLKQFLPTVNNFKLDRQENQNENQLSGTISKMYVNYRKYGGSLMSTTIVLNYPFSANVIIDTKENRYRVTVRDIVFEDVFILDSKQNVNINSPYLKKKNTEIREREDLLKGLSYINSQLSEAFDLSIKKENPTEDNW